MTAKALIEKIQALIDDGSLPEDAEVGTEGCDCNGDVATVEVSEYNGVKEVFLGRSQS